MSKPQFLLVTGRTIYQGVGKEYGKFSKEYFESVAICEIDPKDMRELGIRENENVKVTTNFGTVVVKAVESMRGPHLKVIFIPYGPWASLVMDPRTHGTGMPSLKGISAVIESSSEKILALPELLEKYYGKA